MKKHQTTLKRVLDYIGNYWIAVIISLILAAVTVITTLYVPILIGESIDLMLGAGSVDFIEIGVVLKKIIILTGVTAVSQWLMNHINNKITYQVVKDIRTRAFNHLEALPLRYLDRQQYGDLISRIINDIDQFSEGLLMGFTQLFTGVLAIAGTLFFMFRIHALMTAVVIVITPLSLLVAAFIAKRTYKMFQLQSQTRGELTSLIDEMVGNQKVVKAFGYEARVEEKFELINEKLRNHSLRATFFSSITNPATRFVNGMVYAVVGITGAFFAIQGRLSVGQLTSFLSYANQYTKPFNEISGVITELQNALASAARVFELLDQQPIPDDEGQAVELLDVKGDVEFNHVYFSYVREKPFITDFDLSVKAGQRIAIVGPTGCGKSTLINLLMRFYDADQGLILVDQKATGQLTRKSLRTNLGMVLQDTWLKAGTIRENIAYGRPDASDDEVILAAREAHADSFIRRMPDGYETWITEDGGNLSQGQKQLLCIARVMLTLPPILILDEATSSIDTRTEIKVQKAFAKMMAGRTSFIVAHRLSTIKEADLILVMKDGHIIEKGNHQELLKQSGFYAELYNSQFVG